MKFSIVVATSDERVVDFIAAKQSAAIPSDNRKAFSQRGITLAIVPFLIERGDHSKLSAFIKNTMGSSDGVILICEETMAVGTNPLKASTFFAHFNGANVGNSVQNSLGPVIARALRNFNAYVRRFADNKFLTCLFLPLQNFKAEELIGIRDLFFADTLSTDFADLLDQNLKLLRARRTPKTNTRYEETYLLDDRSDYYVYGKERHKQLETVMPPHANTCELNGNFRFGLKFDSRRHFNVSKAFAKISGKFLDCHGSECETELVSHLNIFPNGFF